MSHMSFVHQPYPLTYSKRVSQTTKILRDSRGISGLFRGVGVAVLHSTSTRPPLRLFECFLEPAYRKRVHFPSVAGVSHRPLRLCLLQLARLFGGPLFAVANRRSVCERWRGRREGGGEREGWLLGAMQSCVASERDVMDGGKSAAMVG